MTSKKYVNHDMHTNDKELGRIIPVEVKVNVKKAKKVYLILNAKPNNMEPAKLSITHRYGFNNTPGVSHLPTK